MRALFQRPFGWLKAKAVKGVGKEKNDRQKINEMY